jgi:hypothetical protein
LTADGAWCKLIVLSLHKGVRREAVAARVREGLNGVSDHPYGTRSLITECSA